VVCNNCEVHHFFGAIMNGGCGIAGNCVTSVLLHSSINIRMGLTL